MTLNIENRQTALITGAGSGIGRALALRLAADKWHIAVADINEAGAQETMKLVEEAGGTAQVELLDVRSEEAWAQLRDKLRQTWPRLDLLVNNAGVCVAGEVGTIPLKDWRWILDINLMGTILGCHTMIPWMKENTRKSYIMNMSSILGLLSGATLAAYSASKFGVVGLSEALYMELKGQNIGVTAICPWFTQTNLLVAGRFVRESERDSGTEHMSRSSITPERVARESLRATFKCKPVHIVGWPGAILIRMKYTTRKLFLDIGHFITNSPLLGKWLIPSPATMEPKSEKLPPQSP